MLYDDGDRTLEGLPLIAHGVAATSRGYMHMHRNSREKYKKKEKEGAPYLIMTNSQTYCSLKKKDGSFRSRTDYRKIIEEEDDVPTKHRPSYHTMPTKYNELSMKNQRSTDQVPT